jgi:uncharacterized protein (TIGR02300 family)
VAKPELGIKRVCNTTGRKFYDLNKTPVVSPYTGLVVPVTRADLSPKASPRVADDDEVELEVEGAEIISLDEAAAEEDVKDTIIEDDIDLGDDDGVDDTFLEEEEEGDDDVSVLIDGDIDTDEEG